MTESEQLRKENDALQAKIEQQIRDILNDINDIKNNLQGK